MEIYEYNEVMRENGELKSKVEQLYQKCNYQRTVFRELQRIINELIVTKPYKKIKHIGLSPHRCKTYKKDYRINREKVFQEWWKKENQRRQGLNMGVGLLEGILNPDMGHERVILPISQRDASVAATVVQWFGTSCGQGFLHEVKQAFDESQEELDMKMKAEREAKIKKRELE